MSVVELCTLLGLLSAASEPENPDPTVLDLTLGRNWGTSVGIWARRAQNLDSAGPPKARTPYLHHLYPQSPT